MLEQTLGPVPANKQKNSVQTRFGRVAIAKTNPFSAPVLGARTSPYLQAKLVLLGAGHVFAAVPPLVESLLGIRVSTSQVYRRTQAAAQALPAAALDAPCPAVSAGQGPVYGMVDGSMIFTDAGWQEVKVGRAFQAIPPAAGSAAGLVGPSPYVAQRGPFAPFTRRFEQVLPPGTHAQQVFVTDGAPWIHHWLQKSYPHATHILDFYHVAEKLAAAAQAAATPAAWLPAQYARLWAGHSPAGEQALMRLPGLPALLATQLVAYLRTNRLRLRYDQFRQRGLRCGSGPVETAHRTLLQVRLKRSGQRWSNDGLDRLVRLRSALKSPQRHLLTDLFKKTNRVVLNYTRLNIFY
ncbi:hypothetical protein [Hymenobacter nivis]|uniref:hypothetical protein n=1 Tax=Hymenobacter nivis TaxID=1850093 RepID=UPI0013A594B6|nr:hypothetical protein [Hymenobacter nivis]